MKTRLLATYLGVVLLHIAACRCPAQTDGFPDNDGDGLNNGDELGFHFADQ